MINIGEVQRRHRWLVGQTKLAIHQAMRTAGADVKRTVAIEPGFRPQTGATQRATTTRIVKLRSGRKRVVENRSPVATYLEKGTRPHYIVPRFAAALRFFWRGAWRFARRVLHPGTRAYHTWEWATTKAYKALAPRLRQRLGEVARRF